MSLNPRAAPSHDPAWLGRLFWAGALLVLLWPLGVATDRTSALLRLLLMTTLALAT